MSAPVFAFEVWPAQRPEWKSIVNTTTRGKAKRERLLDILDAGREASYTDMRARKLGPPHTSEAFLRTAKYRGRPELRCGQRVIAEGEPGVIVGHNDSANLDVLFDESSRWAGLVLNVHPLYVEVRP